MAHARATSRGVYSRTRSRSASKPCVCAATYAASARPSHSSRCAMPWASVMSVPGWICRCRSAIAAVSVRRGSTTIHFCSGLRGRASSSRRIRIGCAHADVAAGDEHRARVVEVFIAGRRRVGTERQLVARHRRAHAQSRVGVDVVGADQCTRELVEDVVVLGQQLAGQIQAHRVGAVVAHGACDASGHEVDRRAPLDGPRRLAALHAPQRTAAIGCAA